MLGQVLVVWSKRFIGRVQKGCREVKDLALRCTHITGLWVHRSDSPFSVVCLPGSVLLHKSVCPKVLHIIKRGMWDQMETVGTTLLKEVGR